MRSAEEIRFRLWQQVENARLLAFAPAMSRDTAVGELPLPDPRDSARRLRGTSYAADIERLANQIAAHRFPLFHSTIDTGPAIDWLKDYVSDRSTGTEYFRLIPYLDFAKAGDHKIIWELNRHQHLVVLAQAWLLTANPVYLSALREQLESWFRQNPFLRGINFASALEVAFRALSWLWIDHLIGRELPAALRDRLRTGMLQHGHFLKANLSTYFSPNTHLLGEGVALYALGLKFPKSGWESLGHRILAAERDSQIQPDGSHFEQSTYYHVYAFDFFLFYHLMAGRPAAFEEPLRKMARFLAGVHGPAGLLSFFGDDDGGRLFHPYGDRAAFGRATLTTCSLLFPEMGLPYDAESVAEQAAWWLAPNAVPVQFVAARDCATVFPDSGLISIVRGDLHLLIDTGPFGPGGAGHSHSDTLAFTVRSGPHELLIDPGTFTYVADPEMRNAFRGSGYHNTVRVDGLSQADPTRPFRWDNKPVVTRPVFHEEGDSVSIDAACKYRGIVHRRRFRLLGGRVLFVLDQLNGPEGVHACEQFWHLGPDAEERMTILSAAAPNDERREEGWRSRCLGSKEPSRVIVYRANGTFPVLFATAFLFQGSEEGARLETIVEEGMIRLTVAGVGKADFPA